MGLMDEAENLVSQVEGGQSGQGGQGGADGLVGELTQDAEKAVDSETGDKFDSEVQDAGTMLDQKLPEL